MERAEQLVQWFSNYPSCLIAFSGGVDSAVVARAAAESLGDRALAVTGVGPAVAHRQQIALARNHHIAFVFTQSF